MKEHGLTSRYAGLNRGRHLPSLILDILLTGAVVVVDLSTKDSGLRKLLKELSLADTSRNRIQVARALRDMYGRGLLTGGKKAYIPTRRAVTRATEEQIWELTIPQPKKWDGKWRMVLYDVPVHKTRQRNMLRERLRGLGLVLYQNSVWVYPYPLEPTVQKIAEFYKISGYVLFAIAERLNGEAHLRRQFKLE